MKLNFFSHYFHPNYGFLKPLSVVWKHAGLSHAHGLSESGEISSSLVQMF